MPNYDGLSPEKKKRQQAAHEKLSGDFKQASRGETPTFRASIAQSQRAAKTLVVRLEIDGTLRLIDNEAEKRRIELARSIAAKIGATQLAKVDRAHQKGALMKEFARYAKREKQMDRER